MELLTKDIRMSIGTGVVIAFGNIARVELNYVWPLRKGATDKYGFEINFLFKVFNLNFRNKKSNRWSAIWNWNRFQLKNTHQSLLFLIKI